MASQGEGPPLKAPQGEYWGTQLQPLHSIHSSFTPSSTNLTNQQPSINHPLHPSPLSYINTSSKNQKPPKKSTYRLAFQNINGLEGSQSSSKKEELKQLIATYGIDVLGMAEVNINWTNVPSSKRFAQTHNWWDMATSSLSYNLHDDRTTKYQAGGTCTLMIGSLASRRIHAGTDPRGLGRWSSITIRGKANTIITFITAYRPCPPARNGPTTVYSQHLKHFTSNGITTDPRQQFLDDLSNEIKSLHHNNHQVILFADLNDPITSTTIQTFLTNSGLYNLHHGCDTSPPLPSHSNGSQQIDIIAGSFGILPTCGGHCSFDIGFTSDHRLIWIELDASTITGSSPFDIVLPPMRRLQTDRPKCLHRYCSHLQKTLKQNGAFSVDLHQGSAHHQRIAFETLDHLTTIAMKEAERKCRKLHTGNIQWSPELQTLLSRIKLWSLRLRSLSGHHIHARTFIKQEKKAGVFNTFSWTEAELKENMANDKKALKQLKKNSITKRHEWLEQLAEDKAKAKDTSKASELKQLIQRETSRATWRRIKSIFKPTPSTLTTVEIPTPDGWKEIHDPMEIEKECLNENNKRFRQASDTPFLSPEWIERLGTTGITSTASDILNGNPPASSPTTTAFLNQFKFLHNKKQSTTINETDFCAIWKTVREKASSSPSGLHHGHYKAICTDPILTSLFTKKANFIYTSGYSPKRWRKGINIMIEKREGLRHISKLRTILLYESDFNFHNKVLASRTLQLAESENSLAPEQFGSRPRKSAIHQATNKRLCFDLALQSHRPTIVCDNDAKSCYDRIVHSIASLALQQQGAPANPIKAMFHTIQHLQHFVRTGHGVSEESFNANNGDTPIQGIGQGNTAGPLIWLVLSTTLFNIMRFMDNDFGFTYTSPISNQSKDIKGLGFVDDTTLVQSAKDDEPISSLISRTEEYLNQWNHHLRLTGGALVPTKCFWYLIHTTSHNSTWNVASINDHEGTISTFDHNKTPHIIEKVSPHEGRRTLGVFLSPTGNTNAQLTYLLSKAHIWASKLKTSKMGRHEVWLSLTATILKTIEYPLTAITISSDDCKRLMAPLLSTSLPAMGFVATFPRDMVYGNPNEYGLGIHDPHVTQGLLKLDFFFSSQYISPSHSLLQSSLEYTQLEVGSGTTFLNLDYHKYHHCLTPTWATSLWNFMTDHHISTTYHINTPKLLRHHDAYLLPSVIQNDLIPHSKHKDFNKCRMYLQVISLSEISTGLGRHILHDSSKGIKSEHPLRDYNWPKVPTPTPQQWVVWRSCLRTTFAPKRSKLTKPMEEWLTPDDGWEWFIHPTTRELHHYISSNEVRLYKKDPSYSRHKRHYTYHSTVANLPFTRKKTIVTWDGDIAIFTGEHNTLLPPAAPTTASYPHHHCSLGSQHYNIIFDGSMKDNLAAYAWAIFDNSWNLLSSYSGAVTNGNLFNSTRAEMTAVWSILQSTHTLQDVTFTIGGDNITALHSINSTIPPKPSNEQFDLLELIYLLRKTMEPIPTLHITKRSSDQWQEGLKIVDTLAKQARCPPLPHKFPTTQFFIDDKPINSTLHKSMRNHISSIKALHYWSRKFDGKVNWDYTYKALQCLNIPKRHFISRLATGWLATNQILHRRRQIEAPTCPSCEEIETTGHIFCCPSANDLWKIFTDDLRKTLTQQTTLPCLVHDILKGLNDWHDGSPSSTAKTSEQFTIGWDRFLYGLISHNICHLQMQHHPSGYCRWRISLLTTLWKYCHQFWLARNQRKHAPEDTTLLDTKIRNEWKKGKANLHQSAHYLLRGSLEKLLTSPISHRKEWIKLIELHQVQTCTLDQWTHSSTSSFTSFSSSN